MDASPPRQGGLRRCALILALASAMCLIAAANASADAFGPQFQVTTWGPPGDLNWHAGLSDIAYNPATNQHLVVFIASTSVDPKDPVQTGTDDVYGQLVDANGNDVGAAFRISDVSGEKDSFNPAQVIYNPSANEFLVAWDVDEEVFVRRVSATGAVIDLPQQVSQPGQPLDEDIETEAMAWSPELGRYLVIWKGNDDSTGLVYGQFVNADGTPAATTDLVLGGSGTLHVDDAVAVRYNATDHEFFTVYRAKPASDEYEIYGQRVDLAGNRVGPQDVRITHMGPDGDGTFSTKPPDVAWNSQLDQYLVGWSADDDTPPLVQGENEVYAQLMAADGSLIGGRIRVSHMGPDGDRTFGAFRPRIVYNANANQFLLTWHGDDNTPPYVDNEYQVYGQVLAADGSKVGTDQFRISQTTPTGTVEYGASRPSVDYNSQTCDYMTVWNTGAVSVHVPTEVQEWEVFGSRVSAPACPPPPPAPPAAKDTKAPTGAVAGVRRACVARSMRIRVRATDASGVARVRVFVDGKRVLSTAKSRFTLRVTARKLKSGKHRLSILITDKAGNRRRITRHFRVCAAAKPRRKAAPRFTG
jgi:hypothetical protein